MFDDEDVCEPKDGFWKEGHEECQKCFEPCRRLCKYFALKTGFADVDEVKRRRKMKDNEIPEKYKEGEDN
jgi:hypothetical protein